MCLDFCLNQAPKGQRSVSVTLQLKPAPVAAEAAEGDPVAEAADLVAAEAVAEAADLVAAEAVDLVAAVHPVRHE